jgi:5-methylcytosine-specific restriction endonuclease McrA
MARSPKWPALRDLFLREHPRCEACGCQNGLEVHHIWPVHRFPDLELSWGNLITLCSRCHLFVGHLGSWLSYNPEVVRDAEWWRGRIEGRP